MRTPLFPALALMAAVLVVGCGGKDSDSPVAVPGTEKGTKTRLLETGAAVLQDKPPVEALNAYLNGFHFYSGHMAGQMEAHHYCSLLNDEVVQCAIYDGNMHSAKLMGVEYIISERLFKALPPAEKTLWHSHVHEVKSGQLIAPGIPQFAEEELMKKLVSTYGKTWHTWHTDQDKDLPLGVPQLMMGFTADGQADPAMVAGRDQRMGVRSEDKRKVRESIEAPSVAPGADAWQQGRAVQLRDPTGQQHPHTHTAPGVQKASTPP